MPEGEAKSGEKGKPSAKEKLLQDIQRSIEEANELEAKSRELERQADQTDDDKVAEDLKFEAREKHKKAEKLIKNAQHLEAGWVQGGAMGTGIGVGIASGLGVTVGSLVTGVVAIPTTGLGMLAGAGTGLVHGPWVKRPDSSGKDEKHDDEEDGKGTKDDK